MTRLNTNRASSPPLIFYLPWECAYVHARACYPNSICVLWVNSLVCFKLFFKREEKYRGGIITEG